MSRKLDSSFEENNPSEPTILRRLRNLPDTLSRNEPIKTWLGPREGFRIFRLNGKRGVSLRGFSSLRNHEFLNNSIADKYSVTRKDIRMLVYGKFFITNRTNV